MTVMLRAAAFALLLSCAAPAFAADNSEKLVEAMGTDQTLANMIAVMQPTVGKQVLYELENNPETKAMMGNVIGTKVSRDRAEAIISDEFTTEFRKSFPEIKAKLAQYLDSKFTDAEIDELIRFYSSGVGAKYIALQPEMQKTMQQVGMSVGMKAGMAAIPRAMERIEAEAKGK